MGFVTVVLDVDEELVPGLTKAQLREIVKRTEQFTDPAIQAVSQQSMDLAASVEIGIENRDARKRSMKAGATA